MHEAARRWSGIALALGRRHGVKAGAVLAGAASPGTYLLLAGSVVPAAVLGAALSGYATILLVALELSPVTAYVTWRRRWEAVGGRAFTALLVYIPLGYLTLVALHLLSPREFPLFDVVVFRYLAVWPFYLWYVLFCLVPGWPCPPAPDPATAAAPA